jgi:hypothetical protein
VKCPQCFGRGRVPIDCAGSLGYEQCKVCDGIPDVESRESYTHPSNPYRFEVPRPSGECRECSGPAHYHSSVLGAEGDWCLLHAPPIFGVPDAARLRYLEGVLMDALRDLESAAREFVAAPGHTTPAACPTCLRFAEAADTAKRLVDEHARLIGQ